MFRQILPLLLLCCCASCGKRNAEASPQTDTTMYTNPLMDSGPDPYAIFYEGKYYYTQNGEDQIVLWETEDISQVRQARTRVAWTGRGKENGYHLWAPELHRINNKWYLYYSADNGHMDNQHIFVLENEAASPMEGEFVLKGCIVTDPDNHWAIHPNVFLHRGQLYMLWSGRPDHRTNQIMQYIYIAGMENPWTLSSERVVLSKPEYEWERQWISPDGNKQDRPAFINESPQFLRSPDGSRLFVFFSASGSWTPYFCTGLLTAYADSDLLNPASWKKLPEPVLMQNREQDIYGPGSVSFTTSPDGKEYYFLYHARNIPCDAPGAIDSRSPRLQQMQWDEKGMPVLPPPARAGTLLKRPSK